MIDWVKVELFVGSATDSCVFIIREGCSALSIISTQHDCIVIFAELWPANKVAISVIFNELIVGSSTAELILLSQELISAKDGEDCENENDKEEYAHQAWNRGQK